MGELVCGYRHGSLPRGGGPSPWDSHMIPPSNVIITCHHLSPDVRGFQVFGEFSAFYQHKKCCQVSKQTLGGTAPSARQFYTDLASGPDTGGMSNGCGEGERRKERKSPTGICDVAQRNMAGYDVWRLKKRTNFHKAI